MRRTHDAIRELIEKTVLDTRVARAIVRKSGIRLGGAGGGGAGEFVTGGFRSYWAQKSDGTYPDITLTPENYLHVLNFRKQTDSGEWYNPPHWKPPAGIYWIRMQMVFELPVGVKPGNIWVYVRGKLDNDSDVHTGYEQGDQAYPYPYPDQPNRFRWETSSLYFSHRSDLIWYPFVRLASSNPITLKTHPGTSAGGGQFTSSFQGAYLGPLNGTTYDIKHGYI